MTTKLQDENWEGTEKKVRGKNMKNGKMGNRWIIDFRQFHTCLKVNEVLIGCKDAVKKIHHI